MVPRRGLTTRVLVVAMSAAPCWAAEPVGQAVQRVVLRLDAPAFSQDGADCRSSGVRIGEDVREVPFARRPMDLHTLARLPVRRGVVRAQVSHASTLLALPRSAVVLAVQRPGDTLPAAWQEVLAGEMMGYAAHHAGWTLHPHPHDRERGKVVVAMPGEQEGSIWNLRLRAVAPMPQRLESREFDVPPGATLELAYGLANPMPATADAPVRFEATLDCAWRFARVIHAGEVAPGDPLAGSWHPVDVPVERSARGCRLRLDARGRDGAMHDPVWAVPRLVAPVGPAPGRRAFNVVLVSLDTLRADRLGGYGYQRGTSPGIDTLLIARGATFTDASTTFPRTTFGHLSILTGRYPAALPASGTLRAGSSIPTLPETLRDAGLATRAITEDGLVGSDYGFACGFDEFSEHHLDSEVRGHVVFADARRYARDNADRQFFLFLHTYRVHSPYIASERYTALLTAPGDRSDGPAGAVPAKHREHSSNYDGAIRELDDLVREFVVEIERLGLGERTLIVLLADHGESFGEHGVAGHGFSAYQESLHVPLIFRGPGVQVGRRIATPVSTVDVAPTLLDLLGLQPLPGAQGRSLRPALEGGELRPRPIFFGWIEPAARGVRWGRWKLLQFERGARLFDLVADPGERTFVGNRDGVLGVLEGHLAAYSAEGARLRALEDAGTAGADEAPISGETEKSLRALGYIQ